MTVVELIFELAKYAPDLPVIDSDENDVVAIEHIVPTPDRGWHLVPHVRLLVSDD